MIQASLTDEKTGRKTLLLGLEEGNVERLRQGKPVHITGEPLGFKGDIMIVLGKDSQALVEMLRPYFSDDTRFRDNREISRQ